jgi:protein ImuB
LFGGERGLVRDVRERFARLGLTARVAIAPTAAAAWAFAQYSPSRLCGGERDLIKALAPLPVSALRLDADTVRTLERLGLKTIGSLLEVPRLALARRFRGAEDVIDALEQRRLGARRLALTGYRVDGSVAVASVATAIPSREPKHLLRLLGDKATALDPEFGFDAFALTAEWTEELGAAQESLVEEPSSERELARLVDRLTVKLGPRAVRRRAGGWLR